MPEPSTLGRNLKRLREALGLSQNALARRSGVSQGFVNNLETGARVRATTDTAQALARALGVTVDDLLHDHAQDAPGSPQAHDADEDGQEVMQDGRMPRPPR